MSTDIPIFISELDAGVFEQKLAVALAEVSAAVIDHDKKGSVNITFDLSRISNSHQVAIKHKLTFSKPTSKGKVSEENTTETPMYVGTKGYLSMFPENQSQFFTKSGDVTKEGQS